MEEFEARILRDTIVELDRRVGWGMGQRIGDAEEFHGMPGMA
jgi:hypothetical protein